MRRVMKAAHHVDRFAAASGMSALYGVQSVVSVRCAVLRRVIACALRRKRPDFPSLFSILTKKHFPV
ncbi:hypothetical protein [Vineibacter terrae]|uniref:hypothetical protein n=1 Tax=Vineibacter terrae TaxID=2586908 RepID=UPI002E3465CB|nr:hypothetical protein [Vineibacter terrae]HEX2891884.1 hypothetical protein [Vineibacter terrae]